uniref:ATP-binding cassette domain-containing protein n=1 Tax=Schlesneria paludicola TaxID=360056 RepID=A0A7C2JYG2_9PLAN
MSDAMQPSGWPLTASQCRRLVIARGLVGRPRALVIDHLLDSLSDEELKLVASRLQEHLTTLTLVVFTAQVRVAQLFPRVVHPQVEHVLPRGAASAHDEADLAAGVPEGD